MNNYIQVAFLHFLQLLLHCFGAIGASTVINQLSMYKQATRKNTKANKTMQTRNCAWSDETWLWKHGDAWPQTNIHHLVPCITITQDTNLNDAAIY